MEEREVGESGNREKKKYVDLVFESGGVKGIALVGLSPSSRAGL